MYEPLIEELPDIIKRDVIIEDIEAYFDILQSNTIPIIDIGIMSEKYKNNNRVEDIVFRLLVSFGVHEKGRETLFIFIKEILNNVVREQKDIIRMVKEQFDSELIDKETLTLRQVTLLAYINYINRVANFIPDFIKYIIDKENLLPIVIKRVENEELFFTQAILKLRAGADGLQSELSRLPKLFLKAVEGDYVEKDIRAILEKTSLGFKGNPFYHIGMWFTNKRIEKIERLRDNLAFFKLKLQELESSGTLDPQLERQIKYYRDKISTLEMKIEKLSK